MRPTAALLDGLPLTFMRQVYPYYIWMLYGEHAADDELLESAP